MTKVRFWVTLLALCLVSSTLFAANTAVQLEKGKQLYAEERYEDAMDYFIDVLVSGTRAQAEEANQYINRIHNRIGGIQDPVKVDVNFKEGEAKRLKPGQNAAILQAQMEAENDEIDEEVASLGLTETAAQDALAMEEQEQVEAVAARKQEAAAQAARRKTSAQNKQDPEEYNEDEYYVEEEADDAYLEEEEMASASGATSTFKDLTSSSALQARQIYTNQKIESMKQAAIAKLEKTKGVRIYFRNNLPDAIDIDSEVLFNGYKFRTEALPVLDEVYTLMALTQGANYIILPPGSYTDNITLAGIRQAMALNSFLVHKGLSAGKLSYNMGLFEQEPPAKFANLEGVSIVFDFDGELPASIPEAATVNKRPMLSMAVVPVANKIDPAAGEAFAIDFSVIETKNPIENWVFQIIQNAGDKGYYVVRQLEGYSPVYHQILWNGRKGIIGPELACGTYTLALTAVDVQGEKSTLRRQIEVACTLNAQKTETKKEATTVADTSDKNLNYKTTRLWKKPGRVMKAVSNQAVSDEINDPTALMNANVNAADAYALQQADVGYDMGNYNQPASGMEAPAQPVNNPYDMPYDTYGNN